MCSTRVGSESVHCLLLRAVSSLIAFAFNLLMHINHAFEKSPHKEICWYQIQRMRLPGNVTKPSDTGLQSVYTETPLQFLQCGSLCHLVETTGLQTHCSSVAINEEQECCNMRRVNSHSLDCLQKDTGL
jgi:hypothetical protein